MGDLFFEHLYLGHLILFRISDLVIRIWRHESVPPGGSLKRSLGMAHSFRKQFQEKNNAPTAPSLRVPNRILSRLPKENESKRIVIARRPKADVAISYRSHSENGSFS